MVIIRLNAGHTSNGNPRRVYVAVGDTGEITQAWDEGYQGYNAVPSEMRNLARIARTFATTPAEYRSILKEFGK